MVFAKIRLPPMTPSARTWRSFSRRMTSAASLATSVAESTEIPTSAACRASASFTPSPRKATALPVSRCTRTIRALCSGLTRANTVAALISAARSASDALSTSCPVSGVPAGKPRSAHTLALTSGLSPMTALTSMPRSCSRRNAAAALAFGGSRNTSRPRKARSRSSAAASARMSCPPGARCSDAASASGGLPRSSPPGTRSRIPGPRTRRGSAL